MNAKTARGPDGVKAFYLSAAKGRTVAIMDETAWTFLDLAKLLYMGFTMEYGLGLPDSISVDHDFVKDQDIMAEKAMGIWVSLSKHRIGSMFSHFGSWPGLFALAASTCENDWDLFTQKLREHFRGYAAAVTASLANPWLEKVVAASPFTFHMVREVAEFYITPTCFQMNGGKPEFKLTLVRSLRALAKPKSWKTLSRECVTEKQLTRGTKLTMLSHIGQWRVTWAQSNYMKDLQWSLCLQSLSAM